MLIPPSAYILILAKHVEKDATQILPGGTAYCNHPQVVQVYHDTICSPFPRRYCIGPSMCFASMMVNILLRFASQVLMGQYNKLLRWNVFKEKSELSRRDITKIIGSKIVPCTQLSRTKKRKNHTSIINRL